MVGALTLRAPNLSVQSLWGSYNRSLERRPVATKAATSLIGFALGDAVAQISSRPASTEDCAPWRYDSLRTLRLAAYGGAVGGPLGHFWFSFLDARVFPKAPKSIQAIMSKIVLDQAFMAPFGATLFFTATKLMDNQASLVIPTIKERLLSTWAASIKLWPVAHAVNFAVIPPSQRLLYINVISIFWTMLLSRSASGTNKTEAIASSPPQMVAVEMEEEDAKVELSLASMGFLEEMEALEAEYDQDLAASQS